MHLKLYRYISFIASPLIDLWLLRRKYIGKEDIARFSERLGKAGLPRANKSLIWLHAASVGEAISVMPLIENIIKQYPNVNILVTTGTVTSAKLLEKKLPNGVFHQYAPIDKIITVRRFLKHWKPNLALWVESELWPNMIIETHKTGCNIIQINARLSSKSAEKWKKYPQMASQIMSSFSMSLAQSDHDADRLRLLGANNVKDVGNLKYDSPTLPANPQDTGSLISMIGQRPLWIAASTHPDEEKIIMDAHAIIKEKYPDVITIIAPRHPERGKIMVKDFGDEFKISLRSENSQIVDNTDIYVADTIGEMGIFYRLSEIAFIGGSLVNKGGQNPLEAARLDCVLITGCHTDNFKDIYSDMDKNNIVIRVKDAQLLAETVIDLLSDHDKQEKISAATLDFINGKKGVLDDYMEELTPYLRTI